jgi:hypothetical protein
VQASKAPYANDEYAPAGRTMIAKYIINRAKAGERDPRWSYCDNQRRERALSGLYDRRIAAAFARAS